MTHPSYWSLSDRMSLVKEVLEYIEWISACYIESFKISSSVLKVLYSRFLIIGSGGVFSPTICLEHTMLCLYELGETEVLFRVPAVT